LPQSKFCCFIETHFHVVNGIRIVGSIGIPGPMDRFLLVRAKMKIDFVKKFAVKLSKPFSGGSADFATISLSYASQNLE
jgi:hypothetical protein